MLLRICNVIIVIWVAAVSLAPVCPEDWGFFGHRRINRQAVFTLPMEMMPFFREHIDYVTEHAVDPDKRRYATRHEGVRHYIDLDHWGKEPFSGLPRKWTEAVAIYSDILAVLESGDTTFIYRAGNHIHGSDTLMLHYMGQHIKVHYKRYIAWFGANVMSQYYEDEWRIKKDSTMKLLGDVKFAEKCKEIVVIDRFSEHGILPYHLQHQLRRLTEAFKTGDTKAILRHSSDFGHYIGDAHVPLHTTKNYNGQFTNQDGIHAFWESRIPELLADDEFDFFVGKAVYIDDPETYFWNMVLESHRMVDSVLLVEHRLRNTFPVDRQMCFDNRLGQVVRTQCEAFARAYNEALRGQIESRFRASILSVGSVWYTAWVDAGQPDLRKHIQATWSDQDRRDMEEVEKISREGSPMGRPHDN